ncbi:CRISPR-associated helicase Cas3' [Streptomyces antimicrobicus]|uniref:CRISPR-associated helicase Cas3 n=1 Tax=Streptomyces antimicrobicus TaxID=2883108 RepID=A0ABS8B7U0_9ACTN|nr:CRISPR-associated helicase Cas3' [Streptomyces antimicrobicus]MCB5180675.1 CRISPR-associated helicase Cas3' [Streptomyces antimicrobicus]
MAQREHSVVGPSRPDGRLWGKARGLSRRYPVMCHLLDAAAACQVLWDVVLGEQLRVRIGRALGLPGDEARAVVSFWAGLHDLGKISPPFQAQVGEAFELLCGDPLYGFAPGAVGQRGFRHEVASHWALAGLLAEAGYPEGRRMPDGRQLLRGAVGHQVAQLLGGHHGVFGGVLPERELLRASEYQPGLGGEGWAAQRRSHFVELRRVTGAGAVPVAGLPAELAVVVWGLVVLSDWLVSRSEVVESLMPPVGWGGSAAEVDEHWRRACGVVAGAVAAAGVGRARFAVGGFEEMFGFGPNPLQRDLVEELPGLVERGGPGLVLVTAPTGDGKTEAALFAASELGRAAGSRGLYVALPTMATADAMFPRVRRFAESALEGERALTLLHSMAWLRPAGAVSVVGGADLSSGALTAAEAEAWLAGRHRGLLAPLGVGTVDQVLTGVLPVRHGAMRLFGLAEKVVVVDEAHAYGPWMHQLMVRLLEWLGALGAPVVLLSATLTGRSATSLVEAYRRGAGFGDEAVVEPRYPGWLYVSAATGEVSAARHVVGGRERTLEVVARPVTWDVADGAAADRAEVVRAGGRREALREELRLVVQEGGTALVSCTTVAEAQQTFRDLVVAFPELAGSEGGLRLLHSRFPARVRQRVTEECEAAYGKPAVGAAMSVRGASVLVATQVVEQSLDLDFDVVISDLAPLAQLLQRAGRCRRHARGAEGRPRWAAREDRPRLVVLDPLAGQGVEGRPPASWGRVYDAGLLKRTSLLIAREGAGVAVPGDVQRLVDEAYAPEFVDGLEESVARELARLDGEREAGESAEAFLADLATVCSPADVAGDLSKLSRPEKGITEELLVTRLGADSGRVLCLYAHGDDEVTLDAAGSVPVPKGGLSREDLAEVVSYVVPVPGRWLVPEEGERAPEGWERQAVLRGVVLLRMERLAGGEWGCRHGGGLITASEVGLERG